MVNGPFNPDNFFQLCNRKSTQDSPHSNPASDEHVAVGTGMVYSCDQKDFALEFARKATDYWHQDFR